MCYRYTFISQGPTRTTEPVPARSLEGIYVGIIGSCWRSWKATWADESTQRWAAIASCFFLPTEARGEERECSQTPRAEDQMGTRCTGLVRSHRRQRWVEGGERKGEGRTWLSLPSTQQSPARASLLQKLTRSRLVKEPEKRNLQGSGLTRKGTQWTWEQAMTSTDTFCSVQVKWKEFAMLERCQCSTRVL